MKRWSQIVLLFAVASIISLTGCQQETKSDPAFKKPEVKDVPEMDRKNRSPEAPAA